MKTFLPFLFLFAFFLSPIDAQTVKTYPAPDAEKISDVYSIRVNGQDVDVYSAQSEFFEGDYYFAYFDFSGSVNVEIASSFPMSETRILPERFGLDAETNEKTVKFTASEPFRISVEPNGRIKPLLLFGNALETDAPDPSASNVVYFGPGVHKTDRIELTDGQTLYLAGGAVVKGCVRAEGKNITICGRGILDGRDYPRFKGPGDYPFHCLNCENLVVRDVILRDPWSWTAVMWNCSEVLIDGLKICGTRMINDDALDLVNTRNTVVRNCFFRTQDDCIAIKGIDASNQPCENILIEDCQFWTDSANIYRIGYECDAEGMRNIVSKRIDALHFSKNFRDTSNYWANAIFWLQPNLNMTIEKCCFEDVTVYSDGSRIIMLMAKPMRCHYGPHKTPDPGNLKDCSFKNLNVVGTKGEFEGLIFICGDAPQWNVDGLDFENVTYFGEKVNRESPCVEVGSFVENIRFK